jgi:hypothetical protein
MHTDTLGSSVGKSTFAKGSESSSRGRLTERFGVRRPQLLQICAIASNNLRVFRRLGAEPSRADGTLRRQEEAGA